MKIYNSLTRKKEEFKPINENEVKMYVCGPTVYNYFHIGNGRTFIVFDTVRKYLEYRGYNVKFVQNFTDIDDRMINKANEENTTVKEVGDKYIEEYYKDADGLNVARATCNPRATEYMDQIIDFVSELIEKGYAYESDGDVYFETNKFSEYGKLSGQNLEDLQVGASNRLNVETNKRHPMDFAIWKAQKPGEPAWESPWGMGRPGWHIECSCMAKNILGDTIDIHAGGMDLEFPHHENEIAQSEALTGKKFAKYWSHCGLVKINGEKMSKSLGNSLTIRDALAKYNYEIIKYMMFSKHYTSDIDLIDSEFALAESHMYYFYSTIKAMEEYIKNYKDENITDLREDDVSEKIISDFIQDMDDDFNTVAAISKLYGIFKYANNVMKTAKKNDRVKTANTIENILKNTHEVYSVIGLLEQNPDNIISELKEKYLNNLDIDEKFIEEKINERAEAKKNKDFELADSIRSALDEKGIILMDTVEGTKWDVKALFNSQI